jgi:nucleotide-binding universal stress UspA family protein
MAETILVPTDGSECAVAAEGLAVALAAEQGWAVLGLYVVDPRLLGGAYVNDVAGAVGATFPGNFVGRLRQVLEARGEAALDRLAAACADVRVPFERRVGHGVPAEAACEAARGACLVALGRVGGGGPWARRLLGSTADTAIRRSPAPVLVVPGPAPPPVSLLVAYDGEAQAGLALTWAARLARKGGRRVAVLAVHADAGEARRIAGVGCAVLETEGIAAAPATGRGDPAEAILAEARTAIHGMVVMGSSRHTAFRDWVLGGTAARVMHESPVPVLLCR